MTAASASTMRRDIASAYLASACKIGSWVVVSAIVYRYLGAAEFAVLALIRGTIGLLNYVSLGLAPALILSASRTQVPNIESVVAEPTCGTIPYFTPRRPNSPLIVLYSNALAIAVMAALAGAFMVIAFSASFRHLFRVPNSLEDLPLITFFMGLGTLLRLLGDVPGAVLQVRSRMTLDNMIVALGELLWAGLAIITCVNSSLALIGGLFFVALWYAVSGASVAVARLLPAGRETGIHQPQSTLLDREIVSQLLAYGGMVVLAQLADYLYAPTDYILINHLLDPVQVADYAPAVQIDAGLLLLVTGLSAVLLPKAALAHAGGKTATIRQYYLRGTLASVIVLAVASFIVWLLSPWIFRVWFGNSMPITRSILPIVLVVTVLGGSSAIGRSILLAVGHVKPFTIAVLIAGVTNVVCSYAFVRWLHLGLKGIVLGTVVAVVGRCVIWMPWYVLRTLRTTPVEPLPTDFSPKVPL